MWRKDAYDKPVDTEGQIEDGKKDFGSGLCQLSSAERGLCESLHDDPQKAEFRFEKGCKSSPDQRV